MQSSSARTLVVAVSLVVFGSSVWACSSETRYVTRAAPSAGEDASSGPADDATPGLPGVSDADASVASSPQDVCAQYLKCESSANFSGVPGLVAAYGTTSPCWKGTTAEAEACGKACGQAMASKASETKLPECGYQQCAATVGASPSGLKECMGEACCAVVSKCTDPTSACRTFDDKVYAQCSFPGDQTGKADACVAQLTKLDPVAGADWLSFTTCAADHCPGKRWP